MAFAEGLNRKVSGFLVKSEGNGVLFEELVLYGNVVQGANHHVAPVLGLVVVLVWRGSTKEVDPFAQFVLDKNQSFHSVM